MQNILLFSSPCIHWALRCCAYTWSRWPPGRWEQLAALSADCWTDLLCAAAGDPRAPRRGGQSGSWTTDPGVWYVTTGPWTSPVPARAAAGLSTTHWQPAHAWTSRTTINNFLQRFCPFTKRLNERIRWISDSLLSPLLPRRLRSFPLLFVAEGFCRRQDGPSECRRKILLPSAAGSWLFLHYLENKTPNPSSEQ